MKFVLSETVVGAYGGNEKFLAWWSLRIQCRTHPGFPGVGTSGPIISDEVDGKASLHGGRRTGRLFVRPNVQKKKKRLFPASRST
jgi:hypothetical protein